jgi:hypothetical protein
MGIPAATLLYILLVLFSELQFSFHWLFFAVAIDIIDWIVSETT